MEYDVRDALVALCMAAEDADDAKLRGILAISSGIPEAKLDFALSELKQGLSQIRMLVNLTSLMKGRQLTAREIAEIIPDAKWIDDDKKQATYSTTVVDEEGEEVASAVIKQRLD